MRGVLMANKKSIPSLERKRDFGISDVTLQPLENINLGREKRWISGGGSLSPTLPSSES